MKSIVISGKIRTVVGKKEARKLRMHDEVPCVLYGGKETIHFYAPQNAFHNLFYSPNAYLIDLEINGTKHNAAMQDAQFHPVSDKLIHIDFKEIFEDKPVTIHIPVVISGNSIGVRNGGKLRQRKRNLKVRALPEDLPDHIEIDITDLEIGKSVNVSDLHYDKLDILEQKHVQIVAVISARAALKGMEEPAPVVAEAAEGAEGQAVPVAEGAEPPKETKETKESKESKEPKEFKESKESK